MQRKTEVALAILVLLMLVAVLLYLFRRSESVETNTADTADIVVDDVAPTTTPEEEKPPQHATPTTVGRIFVERFGSYSTDVEYANVDDVLPLATPSLKEQLQDIADEARETPSSSYYGVSTNVIKITVDEQTDTAQTLTVKTQREEAFDTPGNTSVRYQDIRLTFVKIGDDWFVDRFEWL